MKSIVIYTTKYGSTEKAAAFLKTKISGEVHTVNLMKEKVPELNEYDTVVLGGSIYYGRIQKELQQYIQRNLPQLTEKRIGLFISAGHPDPNMREQEFTQSFPQSLLEHALCKEIFLFEPNGNLSFKDRMIMRIVKGKKSVSLPSSEEKMEQFALSLREG